MSKQATAVTKGPNGQEIKLPKAKHVQVLRGLAVKLTKHTPTEWVNGQKIHYAYDLVQLILTLQYPKNVISAMVEKGYLVPRTEDPEPESYYICTTLAQGKSLRKYLAAA